MSEAYTEGFYSHLDDKSGKLEESLRENLEHFSKKKSSFLDLSYLQDGNL
jgi:hypothetical protein